MYIIDKSTEGNSGGIPGTSYLFLGIPGTPYLEFRGHHESAGQSRQRVADERAVQERSSVPS
jgi:hypothetical protein